MAETKKKGFNLAEALGAVAVPDLGTAAGGREQIEYIDIDRIDDDPNNFYELSALDELAANIELLGLQQPLRVRSSPENTDRVIIVSGHRRRAAIRKLVDDGRPDLREIPCIRERTENSAALQELRLIYANSDTRKLTSAEISRQAERVEMLLYQLKEEGYEFPGRMRDHVAEACKVSKSKLSRLKVIRENLIPECAEYFQKGDLSESSAYCLAKETEDIQRLVWGYAIQDDAAKGRLNYVTEWRIGNAIDKIKRIIKRRCKHPNGTCTHCETILGKVFTCNSYSPCDYYCCADCAKLSTCKDACPKMAEKAAKLKLDTKTKRTEERAAAKTLDQANAKAIGQLWKRFGEARAAGGASVDECFDCMNIKYASISREKYPAFEHHEEKITGKTSLPFGFALDLEHIRRLTNLADLLGCSLDYLLCRTDEPQMTASLAELKENPCALCKSAHPWCDECCAHCEDKCNGSQVCRKNDTEKRVHLNYIDGFRIPTKPRQDAVALFRLEKGEAPVRMIATWINGFWHISPDGALIDAECVGWFPLPEEEDHEDT